MTFEPCEYISYSKNKIRDIIEASKHASKQAGRKVYLESELLKHGTGCLGSRMGFMGLGPTGAQEVLPLIRCSVVAVLKFLIIFVHGALHFLFVLGSTNYIADPAGWGTVILIFRGLWAGARELLGWLLCDSFKHRGGWSGWTWNEILLPGWMLESHSARHFLYQSSIADHMFQLAWDGSGLCLLFQYNY